MTTLISLLGRVKRPIANDMQTTVVDRYRTANYRFPSGVCHVTRYFGLGLLKETQADKVLLLGTSGSSWDIFFEDVTSIDDDALLQLMESVDSKCVTLSMLEKCKPTLAHALGVSSDNVTCQVISAALTEQQQIQILADIANCVERGASVVLDVTHGYRHLPMLSIVSACYLQKVNHNHVAGIYYGALDMTENGITPVLELSGLLHMLNWVDALSAFDSSGDYAVFSPLMKKDGLPAEAADMLLQASFLERVQNVAGARAKIKNVQKALSAESVGVMSRLFQPALSERLSWTEQPAREQQELELARIYLGRGDYLRAATFLQESLVTASLARSGANANSVDLRREELISLRKQHTFVGILTDVRNSMVHGLRVNHHRNEKLLQNSDKLKAELSRICKEIENAIH